MNKKNKNTKSSPFHKWGKKARELGDKTDFWGITKQKGLVSDALRDFGRIDTSQNLWEGAENLMNIGDNFGGVQTDFQAQNAFAGIQNEQQGLRNEFAGMENTMEDLTINQQQAQFETQQGQQQQANILDAMRSGGRIDVQALANQGQLNTQRIAAGIGQQESANQMAAAQQAGRLQEMSAGGAERAAIARAGGAERTQMAIATGAQAATQLGSQAEIARAGGIQAGEIAMGQGEMEAQKFRLQGAADARDLQLQQAQGELSFLAGQQAGLEAQRQSDTAYKFNRSSRFS